MNGSGFYRCPSYQGLIDGVKLKQRTGAAFVLVELYVHDKVNLMDYLQDSDVSAESEGEGGYVNPRHIIRT